MTDYTVIDSDNYADGGIETMFFPGGEPHAKATGPMTGDILFYLKARTWNDAGIGACVWDLLQRCVTGRLAGFIPYFPAARQDKTDGLAPLTIALTSGLFRSTWGSISVFDLHSSKAGSYLPLRDLMPADLDIPRKDDVVGIIAPDAGALARAKSFRNRFYPEAHIVSCVKKRDPQTGRLHSYEMQESLPAKGRYIIVDDICDGGGTFNLLADAFFHSKFGQKCRLEMFVSHGIFSNGLDAIDARIEHITTTDSWCQLPSSDRLTVMSLAPLFDRIMGKRHA